MRTESYEGCTKREFLLYGRKTIIVEPEHALPGKPWVWRTEFFGAFPSADNALLKMGFHLAYHSASDMYGCPEAIAMLEHFREWFCDTWKMSPCCAASRAAVCTRSTTRWRIRSTRAPFT